MNENLQPLADEHLEARITAYILGEASPFEAAEIEELISKSPELKLFANRLRTLNELTKEAETTSNSQDPDWKLSGKRRIALAPILGPVPVLSSQERKDHRIRRASFRAAFGIAAVLLITMFISPMIIRQKKKAEISGGSRFELDVPLPTASEGERDRRDWREETAEFEMNSPEGAVTDSKPASRKQMAKIVAAKPASPARIPVPDIAIVEPSADFGDGDDFGGGFGGGGGFAGKGKDESLAMNERGIPAENALNINGIVTGGLRSGDAAVDRNNIDAILNNPDRTANAGGQMKELEVLREAPTDSPAEPEALALTERVVPPDEAAKPGSRTLGLESKKATAGAAGAPIIETRSLPGLAQRELARRQEAVAEADEQLKGGRDAYEKGDFSEAREQLGDALAKLPDSPALEERRSAIADHLGKASVADARNLRKAGKYDEARAILEKAAAAGGGEEIKAELSYLDDPIRTNPALAYEHAGKVDEVRRKLYMAEGNFDLGKYDAAKEEYEATLRIDPYNKAARRGMEKVAAAKSDYYRAAYDQTRAELLMQVDKAWELEVPAEGENNPAGYAWFSRGENQKADAGDGKYQMNTRAGSERLEADVPMTMNDLFSSSSIAQSGDIRTGGIRYDLSYGYSDGSDQPEDAEFDGFANFGAPLKIEIDGNKQTSDKDIRREVPPMPTFDATPATPTEFESADLDGILPLDPFFDTSGVTKTDEGIEYEINAGYKSEYLFRGADLGADLTETEVLPQPGDIPVAGIAIKEKTIDLADLSEEIPAAQEPFSTFSLNISDASFQVASSAVAKGERPDPETIKPEQFYNAVSYDDPAPSTGEPVAAAIGQVAHPVIPGRNLVRMSVRTASTGRAASQPLVLTLLVDQSGSMARGDRRAAMDTALAQLATLLNPDDRITVIGFSRTPRLLADSLPGDDAGKLPDIINQSSSEGGTNIEQALNLAENLALRHKADGAQNRIVLFTDGAANLGNADPERLAGRVKSLRQQGLAFDIAGIGTDDINDQLLSELSRHGNGRYYLVGASTAGNLAKQLAGAFRPAAENVKIQVKFNPQRVGNYKLIGFEKDRLKTEDFRNDSVDAAELAADESGTALYQVEPLPDGTGEIGELFVRFRDTATGEMVERSWTIPYESQAPAIDKAQPPMQLAALSMLAAQKLQPGPLADAINFRDLAPTISVVKKTYARSPEAQQMITLINALK